MDAAQRVAIVPLLEHLKYGGDGDAGCIYLVGSRPDCKVVAVLHLISGKCHGSLHGQGPSPGDFDLLVRVANMCPEQTP